MKKIAKPKFYLSYSRINLYHTDPHQYYITYVLGQKPKPTPNMTLGSIGHKAIQFPNYDWRRALRRRRFMSSAEAMLERAVKEMPRTEINELEFLTEWKGIPLYGFIDGINPGVLRERKFAAPGAWSQAKVDEDQQISFYWFCMVLMGSKIKCAYLDHANNKTGLVSSYMTKRTKQDLKGVENWIQYAHDGITKGVYT